MPAGSAGRGSAPGCRPPPAVSPAPAENDYRQFFKKPQTVLEFWSAIQFEIELGRFDLAGTQAVPQPLKDRALRRLADRLVDGVLVVTAAEHRSQLQNRRAAEARLVALLAAAIAPPGPARRATRPTRTAVERRLDSKRRHGQNKRLRRPPVE